MRAEAPAALKAAKISISKSLMMHCSLAALQACTQLIDEHCLAGALNFRDVMLAYGKLSKQQMAHESGGDNIGFEFSGVEVRSHDALIAYINILPARLLDAFRDLCAFNIWPREALTSMKCCSSD